jgi:16S rRNA (adenine1518-N6/adenine1519-N6)-dimethyltransferase
MKNKGAKLGQHFLRSQAAVSAMVGAAHIDTETTVLEIGPGEGVLTRELLTHAKRVIAIEKDGALVMQLRETFEKEIADGTLTLIEGDIRDADITQLIGVAGASSVQGRTEPQAKHTDLYGERGGDSTDKEMDRPCDSYVVAANIPYYITGEIIRALLTSSQQPKHIALLIQKEVATRIVARDKKESILSLSVKAYGTPKIVKTVPRGSFSPPPSVDSAIIAIEDISRDFFKSMDEDYFFEVIKAAFGSKRKMLVGNLKAIAEIENIVTACTTCGIDVHARAEDVPLEKWGCLVRKLRE